MVKKSQKETRVHEPTIVARSPQDARLENRFVYIELFYVL